MKFYKTIIAITLTLLIYSCKLFDQQTYEYGGDCYEGQQRVLPGKFCRQCQDNHWVFVDCWFSTSGND